MNAQTDNVNITVKQRHQFTAYNATLKRVDLCTIISIILLKKIDNPEQTNPKDHSSSD